MSERARNYDLQTHSGNFSEMEVYQYLEGAEMENFMGTAGNFILEVVLCLDQLIVMER